jgi:dihydrofolate synthase/folylpolyglutamate synthase
VVYTVRADGGARAAEADALATLVGANAVAESDLQTAYHKALDKAGEDGVVCVCGSLYLVGEFKAMLQREKEQCH